MFRDPSRWWASRSRHRRSARLLRAFRRCSRSGRRPSRRCIARAPGRCTATEHTRLACIRPRRRRESPSRRRTDRTARPPTRCRIGTARPRRRRRTARSRRRSLPYTRGRRRSRRPPRRSHRPSRRASRRPSSRRASRNRPRRASMGHRPLGCSDRARSRRWRRRRGRRVRRRFRRAGLRGRRTR